MEKQHVYLMIKKTDKASYCTNIKETKPRRLRDAYLEGFSLVCVKHKPLYDLSQVLLSWTIKK